MTAEVAILNKSAVALAADSAVTFSIGGKRKINNSVNKLFELSFCEPIGIMIYGDADFMGIPIETVIKEYRGKSKGKSFPTVFEYAEDFFRFCENEIASPQEMVKLNLSTIISSIFVLLQERISAHLEKSSYLTPNKFNKLLNELPQFLISQINALITEYSQLEDCNSLESASIQEIEPLINEVSDILLIQIPNFAVNEDVKEKCRKLSRLVAIKRKSKEGRTGLVFAGYGKDDLFPSLIAFEHDSVIGGKIKRAEISKIDIDRTGDTAALRGFAQSEMVDQFMGGIDNNFFGFMSSLTHDSLHSISNEILSEFKSLKKSRRKELTDKFEELANNYHQGILEQISKYRKENYINGVTSMLDLMPKPDLAQLAESLVELTSTKRRASDNEETVGGPIDVAVISKGEGFIWVKRKHYFDPNLNKRFLSRDYERSNGTKETENE